MKRKLSKKKLVDKIKEDHYHEIASDLHKLSQKLWHKYNYQILDELNDNTHYVLEEIPKAPKEWHKIFLSGIANCKTKL